jgi:iron(III) transport system ATP-binding protein
VNALSVRDLRKRYGKVHVLSGVSLDLAPGTTAAILGPSGCGKTTLLRLIAGFDHPDAGTIELHGRPVSAGRRALAPDKRDIGYVAQEGALFPHLTVEANIAFGLSRLVLRGLARRRRVAELLDLVSLDPALTRRYPHELSGGQQQRVALARALARRPALVLLDEPFSSLDTALRAATRTAVADALRAQRVTTLLVTHDQAEALSLSDQIVVMTGGRFTQTGPARELYAHPADLDTARLLGPGTTLDGKVDGDTARCALGALPIARPCPDGDAIIFVRPEQIHISPAISAVGDRSGRSRSATASPLPAPIPPRSFAVAIEAMEETYAAAGVARFVAWVHERDQAMRGDLERRRYRLDESTRAMGMALEDLQVPRPKLELARPDWSEYVRILGMPPAFLHAADRAAFHVLVARLDGENVATAMALDRNGDCGIYNVTTLEHARNHGLGTALTLFQLHDALERGCATASLQSTAMAEHVYAAAGFRDLGRILEYVP